MGKRIWTGFLCGVAVDYIVAMAVSYILDLGYFMPCLAAMPELLGGEMRSVVLQALAFGLLGGGLAAAFRIAKMTGCPARRRFLGAALLALLSATPLIALAALLAGKI